MTVAEFESYLEKGLGRAILLLKQEPDKMPFREVALNHLIRGEERHYFAGASISYDLDLIACFDEPDILTNEVADGICCDIEEGGFFSNHAFLLTLGREDAYRASYQKRYRTFYDKTVSHMKTQNTSQEAMNDRQRFLNAVIHPLRNGQWGREEMKIILADLAELYALGKETGYFMFDAVQVRVAMEKQFGRDEAEAMIHEVADAHPLGDLLIKSTRVRYEETPPPDPAITAEEILNELVPREIYEDFKVIRYQYAISFAVASPEVVRQVAEALLAEKDLECRMALLTIFAPYCYIHGGIVYEEPVFPLGAEALFSLLDDVDWEDAKQDTTESHYLFTVVNTLSAFRHPKIKALGERLRNKDMPGALWIKGVEILMRHYTPADRETVITCLNEATDIKSEGDPWASAIVSLLYEAQNGNSDLPLDILPKMWERIPFGDLRKSAVEVLLQYGMLPDDLREECRYDRSDDIRKLVQE